MHNRTWLSLFFLLAILASLAPAALAQGPEVPPEIEESVQAPGIENVSWRYDFSSFTGTYTEITGGTQVTTSCDDESYSNYPIGFTFTYDGIGYTAFSIQCNGFIAMGTAVESSYTPISTGTTNNVIAGLGMDLQTNATNSEIRYELLGTGPNRVLVVQYKNLRNYNQTGDSYNLQIRLYETSNTVEVVYGEFVKNATARLPQVGLRGAGNADFNNRMTDATHFWANSLRGTFNSSTMALDAVTLPGNGLTFDWTVHVGVAFDPPAQSNMACKGNDLLYNLTVVNLTPAAATFDLSYASVWPTSGPTVSPQLAPGETWPFQVLVHIPWTAHAGDVDLATVTATGGGYSGQATIRTSASYDFWEDVSTTTPRPVRAPSVVYNDGKLYKIGGYDGAAQAYLDIYDVATGAWTTGAAMPAPRYGLDCVVIGDGIYCAGGYSTVGETTLYRYDIPGNSWTTQAAMSAYRYDYVGVAMNGKYYVIGGYGAGYVATIWEYDPATNSWNYGLPGMVAGRRYASGGLAGGKIYVAGGYNGTYLSSVEVYDPVANNWTPGPAMPSPWLTAADGVRDDRYLVLAGGSATSTALSTNQGWILDTVAGTWVATPPMPYALYGAEADSDGSTLYVMGGRLSTGSYSPYTIALKPCAASCTGVSNLTFTWDPAPAVVGEDVSFHATADGTPPIQYEWDFGDGNTGVGPDPVNVFAAAGPYPVEVTATNCEGASSTSYSQTVDVYGPPAIDVQPTSLDVQQCTDDVTTHEFEICNLGDLPLTWEVSEFTPLVAYSPADDLPWLSESPVSGTVPGQSCVPMVATVDSTGMPDGQYLGGLQFLSNDPVQPELDVPVTLTVSCPNIIVTPPSLSAEQCPDIISTQPLTICNRGTVPLNWEIGELTETLRLQWQAPAIAGPAPHALEGPANVGVDPIVVPKAPRLTSEILVDQQPNQVTGVFADAGCDICAGPQALAENFALEDTATIEQIVLWSGYHPNDTPIDPDVIRVRIHQDAGGLPGAVVYDESDVAYARVQTGIILFGVHEWRHTLTLDTSAVLPAGNYWVEIYNDTGWGTDDYFWETGDLDPVRGLVGSVWALEAPGANWLYDNATELSMQLIGRLGRQVDVPWLAEDPLDGTVPAGECQVVDVSFDSTGLGPGVYNAGLLISSDDPVTPEVAVPVELTVDAAPDAVVTAPPLEAELCSGETTTIDVSLCNAGECTLDWNVVELPADLPWLSEDPLQGSLPGSDCATVTVTFDTAGMEPGVYTGFLRFLSNDPGEPEITLPVTLTVGEPASIVQVDTVITDLMVAFTPEVVGTPPIDYAWDFGDGNTSTETNPVHTYAEAGCYSVTLDIANGCGMGSWAGQVCVEEGCDPVHDADFSWYPPTPLVNEVVYFTGTAAGTGPITYEWDLGDGTTATGQNVNHAYCPGGTYTVVMTATGECGFQVVSYDVTVSSECVPPGGADFNWMPITPTAGANVAFAGTVLTGTTPLTFDWAFSDGGTASGQNVSHVFADEGSYVVTMTVANGCGTDEAVYTVVVEGICQPPTGADFEWTPVSPVVNGTVTFTGGATGTEPFVYTWDMGDGATCTGASITHTYALADDYTVVMTTTNGCGVMTTTQVVTVAPLVTQWSVYLPLVDKGYAPLD